MVVNRLSFKCEHCDEVGDHICLERLINHFALYIQQCDEEEASNIQDLFLEEDNVWWEDQLGDAFWEGEEDEEE